MVGLVIVQIHLVSSLLCMVRTKRHGISTYWPLTAASTLFTAVSTLFTAASKLFTAVSTLFTDVRHSVLKL